jgi:hypothetical protein
MAKQKSEGRDAFDAMLRDYRGNRNVHYVETDGSHRPWPELLPEAKLGYLARDAAIAGATPEHFVQAAREFLGDLPPAVREAAALRVALDGARELHAVAALLPPDNYYSDLAGRPLVEQLEEYLGEMQPKPDTVRQMLDNVEAVTKARFYADPEPVSGPVEMFPMPEGKPGGEPFAELSHGEKWQVLGDYTPGDYYEQRGVTAAQANRIFHNVVDGKPREQWLEGTGLDGRPAAAPKTRGEEMEPPRTLGDGLAERGGPSGGTRQRVGAAEGQRTRPGAGALGDSRRARLRRRPSPQLFRRGPRVWSGMPQPGRRKS